MEYIVFDLEWNQCPEGKRKEDVRLPFEIIEIGAVKLNEDRVITDQFHVIIKPQVYQWIHVKTKAVIHMDMKNLENGIPFPSAARQFLEWCGEDYKFCTWGDLDLMEFQRNMKYYHMEKLLEGPIPYYDVQKIFSRNFEDGRSRKSLEYGIDYLEIEKDMGFHRALADAWYTAKILQELDINCLEDNYSIDVYQNPKCKKEEIHIFYKTYTKYISREFTSKEAAMKDREVCSTKCPSCRKPARRMVRWFAANPRHYYSVSWCEEHGCVKGKVRIKKTDEGKVYAVKTLKVIDAKEAKKIQERQESLRHKRQLKRRQEKFSKNG